jgi:hypothetical protein
MRAISLAIILAFSLWQLSCKPYERPRENAGGAAAAPAALSPTGSSGSLKAKSGTPLYNPERIGDVIDPVSKQPVSVATNGVFTIAGWAADGDAKKPASGVDVVIDGVPMQAEYGSSRADVATHFGVPAYGQTGFQFSLPASMLPKGTHSVTVRVIANDGSGYYQGVPIAVVVQ